MLAGVETIILQVRAAFRSRSGRLRLNRRGRNFMLWERCYRHCNTVKMKILTQMDAA